MTTTVQASATKQANPLQVLKELREAQEKEIKDGQTSGDITPEEAKKLARLQNAIAKMEAKAQKKGRGKVSSQDLALIKQAREFADDQIYSMANNRVVVKKTYARPQNAAKPLNVTA